MYLKPLIKASFIGVLAGALIACGSDDDDSPDNTVDDSSQTSTPVNPDNTPDVNTVGAPPGLNGSWLLSCRPSGDSFETIQLDIQDDVIVSTLSEFSDSACTNLELFNPLISTVSVVYSGTTETALGTATNIDTTVESVSIVGLGTVDSDGVEANEVVLDILLVMGDSLFLGEVEDEADPDNAPRPVQLNQTEEYIRLP